MSAPRPLDGVRILALEQLQSLPVGTQMLSRLGADVVRVEPPGTGEAGRSALPTMKDRDGQPAGATFLRYALGKRSIAIDFASPRGRDLILSLAPHFDIACENLGPGRADRFGIGYPQMSAVAPRLIYASISGFGTGASPYANWPAYAGVVEAMSGTYEYARLPHEPPVIGPMCGMGDTVAGLNAVIGILAALRHREMTGAGQFIDIAMYDGVVHVCDLIPNYWSMGVRREMDEPRRLPGLFKGFRAKDGWFIVTIVRRHQFERFARTIGRSEWLADPALQGSWDWEDRAEDVIRPAVESWAARLSKTEAAAALAEAGVAAGPCHTAADVSNDPHVRARAMLVEVPRPDGGAPVLVAGNPVKMSAVPEDDRTGTPLLGEHTDMILRDALGLRDDDLATLRRDGVIG